MKMKRQISFYTAASIVVANMVGTGVFTSLGFQLMEIKSVFVILVLWAVGGITALCGALSYGELGAALPRSGGEYNFLSQTMHPSIGFVAGWISATIGFAAPTALVCMTFGAYFSSVFPSLSPVLLAILLLLVVTSIHVTSVRTGGRFQRIFTFIKVLLILIFALSAFIFASPQAYTIVPQASEFSLIGTSAFAVSLIYVSYAFTGWNAGTYLISELKNPSKDLPRALILGTALVTILYLVLNLAFLHVAPMAELEGELEVGYIAAKYIFGEQGGELMAIVLSVLLISTASAMIFAGPRVLQVIGEDYPIFSFLKKTNKNDVPARAILFQSGLSLIFILSATFEQVLVYAGFILALSTFFTVSCVYILRWKSPDLPRPYKTWGYPVTPAIYLALIGWTLVFLLIDKPIEAYAGLGTVVVGFLFYLFSKQKS